jgi:hypothetical protein
MTRRLFTKNLAILITEMVSDGNEPILDHVLRSKEEQLRLYSKGRTLCSDGTWIDSNPSQIVTKCDGVKRPSAHQKGEAADIYFVVTRPDGTVFIDYDYKYTSDLAIKYHKRWEELGGKPMLEWDKPHYELGAIA